MIDPGQPTPPVTLKPLPAQHESFDKTWRELSDKLKLVPQGVRAIGPTMLGPAGQTIHVAPEVRLHPVLVSRFGKRCVTILDEGKPQQQQPRASTSPAT